MRFILLVSGKDINGRSKLFLLLLLFRKNVITEDSEYWYKVLAETLFRIDFLQEKNCSCSGCKMELDKLLEFLPKIKQHLIKLRIE